jgi:hypothetical protein
MKLFTSPYYPPSGATLISSTQTEFAISVMGEQEGVQFICYPAGILKEGGTKLAISNKIRERTFTSSGPKITKEVLKRI